MSREIKFRIWSYEDKQYRTDCNLTQIFNSMTGTPATVYSDEGDRFDIEQYTGLKDKNGKEIYEGDLIRVSNDEFQIPSEDKTDGAEVIYSEFETGFVYKTWYGRVYVGRHDTSVEVIGNIHENPELVGGKQ